MSLATVLGSMPVEVWVLCLSALAIGRLLHFRFKKGLSKYNGPFLASFTDLWRVHRVYANRDKPPMLDLHEKYGDIVRVGPNILCFGKPEAIKDIYGSGKAWNKSGFYTVQAAVAKGQTMYNLFSSADIPWHNALRKAINPSFTATASVGSEYLIDKTIDVLLEQWEARFACKKGPEGIIDLASWMIYFSFDVSGELTYGSRHGFMESGWDSQGIIADLHKFATYGAIVGPWSFMDKFLRHNPVLLWLERQGLYHGSTSAVGPFIAKRMRDRIHYYSTKEYSETKRPEDLLDKFLNAKVTNPNLVTDREVLMLSLTMLFAGAETISTTLTALFYYLLKTPNCYAKLQHELDTHLPAQDLSSLKCDVDFTFAQKLPYMHACVQETFRMHPASADLLERVVPPPGADIGGERIPGGTVVGVSSWSIHRNKKIFGEDANVFRPERWLEASEEQVRSMEKSMLHFGAGNHLCLGRNISVREIYKVVPSLLRTFKMELVDAEREWSFVTTLGTRLADVCVRIERRTAGG